MSGAAIVLAVLTVAAVLLVTVLVRRPELAATAGGRMFAAVALLALPGLLLLGGANHHYERAKTTAFCGSCHAIQPFVESLAIDHPTFLPAAHFQNHRIPKDRACYTCHTNYTMFGDLDDKIRGVRHVWHALLGTTSTGTVELYRPFPNRTCFECHEGARSYEEQPAHEPYLADLRAEARSCLMCHNLVHEVATMDRFGRYPPDEEGP